MAIIYDGTGMSWGARVSQNYRLQTSSVTTPEPLQAAKLRKAYVAGLGLATLTSAAESGVLYLKNNEDLDIYITKVSVCLGATTGGAATDTVRVRMYRNPTTGTLISTATAVAVHQNLNFIESSLADVTAYQGTQGSTITNGTVMMNRLTPEDSVLNLEPQVILPKGAAIAVSIQPATSNTSMKVSAEVNFHLQDSRD